MKGCVLAERFTVGLDLGGTKLAGALVHSSGEILSFHKASILHLKTGSPKIQQRQIIDLMASMILNFKKEFPHAFQAPQFAGVGLASAGPMNVDKGCLLNPTNFPGWKTAPLQKDLMEILSRHRIKTPVAFQNDAIAAALAEGWMGGAKGLKSFAVVTIGTGIGSGVIFNGQPVQTNGMGSEFGHLIVQNNLINSSKDLRNNTVEGIASGTGILRRAKNMGFKGNSIEELVQTLESGEKKYQVLFDEAADALAALCYNLSIGFNLEKILFSGGLIKVRSLYYERMKKRYLSLVNEMNPYFRCPIQVAKGLNQAGVLGAAYLPYLADFKRGPRSPRK